MIELRHLRYFLAVVAEGHVTRAAARLGIQQPPLSQQIRALETAVGVPLLRRHPRGVEVTAAGRAFAIEAEAALARVERAVEAAQRTARGEAGRLTVGYASSAAFHPLIPAVVRGFREAAPDVALKLEEGSTVDLVAALRDEELDLAFVRVPASDTAGVVIEPLLREAMWLVLPAGHPLAADAPRPLPLRALAGETFILYRRPTGPGLHDAILAACQAAGFVPRAGQEAPRLLSTLSLVASGLGISIIPDSMRRLDTEGLAYRPLRDAPALVAPLHLAYREGPRSGAVERMLAEVRREAARQAGRARPGAPSRAAGKPRRR
jgi:DNA-binding transcriptional LysR family regulator